MTQELKAGASVSDPPTLLLRRFAVLLDEPGAMTGDATMGPENQSRPSAKEVHQGEQGQSRTMAPRRQTLAAVD